VPAEDWPAVKTGHKREFRSRAVLPHLLADGVVPTAVVAYMTRRVSGQHERKLMVLERSWREPLAAISEDSIKAEGFPDMAHFRRYWTSRTKTRFRPLDMVQVFNVRPFTDDDIAVVGAVLFRRLYGEFTGAGTESTLLSRRSAIPASLR
jgi:hypothetical protein